MIFIDLADGHTPHTHNRFGGIKLDERTDVGGTYAGATSGNESDSTS
jgi:hypothetical protein